MNWKEFWHDQFDKLLLFVLIVIILFVHIFGSKDVGDFAVRTLDTLVGALVAVITGKIYSTLKQQQEEKKKDGQ